MRTNLWPLSAPTQSPSVFSKMPPVEIRKASRPFISPAHIGKEPFRLFFPLGLLAGMIGVALWPLHFAGTYAWYPGQIHARLMAYGFFGAFIVGFLGTAMPRMLSARPLGLKNVAWLAAIHAVMIACLVGQAAAWADGLFLALLVSFGAIVLPRALRRKDLPPPGFVLVALAGVSVFAGTVLALAGDLREISPELLALQKLLSYQGFVLLPILGIGPFILPRFFGLQSAHEFPEMLMPSGLWKKKAALAVGAAMLIFGSFFLESFGFLRWAYAIRFAAVAAYLLMEFPFRVVPKLSNAFGITLRLAFVLLVLGLLTVAILPGYRVALLHLTLVGGFAVITFAVASRVILGHSGVGDQLKQPNRWFYLPLALLLLGMATRISGDFLPQIMASHYSYGAIAWICGALIWAVKILPNVLRRDPED
jgi:uncharacterized protein involved in response to NO